MDKDYLIHIHRDPDNDDIITNIDTSTFTHMEFGIIVCDLVRHIANAFQVAEDDVWKWVDKERNMKTTAIKGDFLRSS